MDAEGLWVFKAMTLSFSFLEMPIALGTAQ
jgi:hypothetical protein